MPPATLEELPQPPPKHVHSSWAAPVQRAAQGCSSGQPATTAAALAASGVGPAVATVPLPPEVPDGCHSFGSLLRKSQSQTTVASDVCMPSGKPGKWQVWKNCVGMTKTIWDHLKLYHTKDWCEAVVVHKFKGWEELASITGPAPTRRHHEPFTLEGLHWCLVKWIVADDQLINVMEGAEFRDLLLYTGDNLDDDDIPHCTKMTQLIRAMYYERCLVIRSRLSAFRHVCSSHEGVVLAKHFIEILEELGLLRKYNDGSPQGPTESEGDSLLCFPHVINIAVQTSVQQLTVVLNDVYQDDTAENDLDLVFEFDTKLYDATQNQHLMEQACTVVHVSKASGHRWEEFQDTIKEGNAVKLFRDSPLPEAVLLLDVDTRWSSIYAMIDHVLELNQAIDEFLKWPNQEAIQHNRLRQFLQAPHLVQEVLSVQKTPTLSMALPGYEKLLTVLGLLKKKLWQIAHGIDACIKKLEEYLGKAHQTDMYILAMSM
ncbi:hypothetical protein DAEQUDRAFT_742139 [Daedalea quercina L-15889]|uniref:Uncharacterized protein n=1 Tax=Daedalea quercina L-15889 TaxID=1314783 RepID=A0A165KFD1_9APHY|nr:hypothetical protein DAEQUDRAFT_742139 [Daedalea quercina L-15889]